MSAYTNSPLPTLRQKNHADLFQGRIPPSWRIAFAWTQRRPAISQEFLALLASLYFSIFCNDALWRSFAGSSPLGSFHGWLVAASFFIAITALHWILLVTVMTRRTAKPLLAVVILVTAAATYYMDQYTVYLNPDMIRNVLHTDSRESAELLTPRLFIHIFLYAALPMAFLFWVRLSRNAWKKALLRRLLALVVACVLCLLAIGLSFQDLAALMRNQKQLRYLITPGNYVASLAAVLAGNAADDGLPLKRIGEDAKVVAPADARPKLLVIVVGETVRAQNWGLNGYARQTTPELAKLDVLNFTDVTACGSSTEVSLPCMFSVRGRRDYDQREIRRTESLLHVLARAGVSTLWRDNQTGCKGVCKGLPFESFLHANDAAYCDGQRCLDEILLKNFSALLKPGTRDRAHDHVIVLHPLGNHGPGYSSRYPPAFKRFTPTCETVQLGECSRQEIVNSYDNAILYADHFLARTIALLDAQADFDTAMIYVSDHGESLGEHHLYLHGMPYAIAPDVQIKVPMVLWQSSRWLAHRKIDPACLKQRLAAPLSHDNLFSTTLGMMQVQTGLYEEGQDLLAGCMPTRQIPSGATADAD